MTTFQDKVKALRAHHEELLSRKNEPVEWGNGIYDPFFVPKNKRWLTFIKKEVSHRLFHFYLSSG